MTTIGLIVFHKQHKYKARVKDFKNQQVIIELLSPAFNLPLGTELCCDIENLNEFRIFNPTFKGHLPEWL